MVGYRAFPGPDTGRKAIAGDGAGNRFAFRVDELPGRLTPGSFQTVNSNDEQDKPGKGFLGRFRKGGGEGKQPGAFARLRERLGKSRQALGQRLADTVLGSRKIDDELFEEIETLLLTSDVGVEATASIIDALASRVKRRKLDDAQALYTALREELHALLQPCEAPMDLDRGPRPFVIMVVGVNGAGKTTTIGKLARRLQGEGRSVMLAAGDTFRAAAVEQLQSWGERTGVPVIAQHTGADSASVIFDAFQSARSRDVDVLIADTAGRLHTQGHLMEELKKIRRVLGKQDESAPHEVLLVLDGGTGQNALAQARQFHEAVNVTGLAVTKLDGTARGGVLFALARELGTPIRYIGVGESVEDLRDFQAEAFVDALMPRADAAPGTAD